MLDISSLISTVCGKAAGGGGSASAGMVVIRIPIIAERRIRPYKDRILHLDSVPQIHPGFYRYLIADLHIILNEAMGTDIAFYAVAAVVIIGAVIKLRKGKKKEDMKKEEEKEWLRRQSRGLGGAFLMVSTVKAEKPQCRFLWKNNEKPVWDRINPRT